MIASWLVFGLLALALLWAVGSYNALIRLRNRLKEAWSDITVQLKRRYDLIPNLIESVKGYAKHEKTVFTEVTKARANAINTQGVKGKQEAENMLTQALRSVFAVAENYPQLRASENFQQLQANLTDTENKIEASRRYYNGTVREFNNRLQVFPTNLIAKQLGFSRQEFFEVDESQKEAIKDAPKVKFD